MDKESFDAFFSLSSGPALILDEEATVIAANPRLLNTFQLIQSDLEQKNFFNVFNENQLAVPFTSIIEGLETPNQTTTVSLNGFVHTFQWSLYPIENLRSATHYLLQGFEVTQFVNVQQREQLIKASIIDHIPNHYIFWKDVNSVYLGCNTTLAKAVGLKRCEDIIGKTDYDLPTTKAQSDAYRADDQEVMQTRIAKLNIEEFQTLKDGKIRILMTNKAPLFDENNDVCGILAIYSDISERKKLERDLEQARDQAQAADRAKSKFIANMSHDIRTPLTGIIGLSNLLKDDITDPIQKEYTRMLNKSGEQLLSLLNSVLDIIASDSIKDKRHISLLNLHEMLQSLIDLETPTVQIKGIKLLVEIDSTLPKCIYSDKEKLYRILLNLLSNAIKFTPTGTITMRARLNSQGKEQRIEFQVEDTGVGIACEDKEKIFDEFFRATPSYEGRFDGYGVGLHIVQQYLLHLSGDITVESEQDKGTTITFTIPLHPPSAKH